MGHKDKRKTLVQNSEKKRTESTQNGETAGRKLYFLD